MNEEHPRQIDGYDILEPLGEGGMGVVYRARHAATGRLVALKTLRAPRASLLQGIRREIQSLARLRHPCIVPIVAEGVEAGVPWYAMEIIPGATLRQCLLGLGLEAAPSASTKTAGQPPATLPATAPESTEEAADLSKAARPSGGRLGRLRPEPLRTALGILRRLCDALAFLHGEGLVHRDLKPENVLVRPDGWPVLVDFGLAARFSGDLSREDLELGGRITGTIAYMAPEQGRGELVDARADLYSLGCILYELLAGRPPFEGSTRQAVLLQHLGAPPIPPSRLAEGVPPELEALALRLLRKDPRERLGYAQDVATALGRLGAAEDPATAAAPRAYLYRPRFVGRQEPMDLLRGRIERLDEEGGGLILIGGESGIGKTRLAVEAGSLAQSQRRQVLASECGDGAALHPFRKMLQRIADLCREGGAETTERLLGARGKVLALLEPSLATLPGQESRPAPTELPPDAARLRLFRCMAETLAAGANVLILDDLQGADEASLAFLDYLARRLSAAGRDLRLLVLGVYRTEEAGDALHRLLEAPRVGLIELGRLREPEIGAIVSDMLALTPTPELFARFLARHSEGNPFFVAEYLRAALAEGLMFRDADGHWQIAEAGEARATSATYEALPLPRSLNELIERRIAGLGGSALALAQAAAVLGQDLPLSLLERVAPSAVGALDELLRRQILEEPQPRQARLRLRFIHERLRGSALARIEAGRLVALHRAAAAAIEELGLARERLAELGRHWEMAGEPARARAAYLAGAEEAARGFGQETAERLYRAYLRLVDEPTPESMEARIGLGSNVLLHLGKSQEARIQLLQAVADARELGERRIEGRALAALGRAHWWIGRFEEARTAYEQALEPLREAGSPADVASLLCNMANLLGDQGRLEESWRLHERAFELGSEAKDLKSQAASLANLGILCIEQGRLEQAGPYLQRAIEIFREAGDRLNEGITLGSLATLHTFLDQPELAWRIQEQALAIHREIGARRNEARVLSGRLELALSLGRLEVARGIGKQALELAREVQDLQMQGFLFLDLAHLERRLGGSRPEAERLMSQAEALASGMGDWIGRIRLLCERGHWALLGGDRPAARTLLEQARKMAGEMGMSASARTASGKALLELAQALGEGEGAARPPA